MDTISRLEFTRVPVGQHLGGSRNTIVEFLCRTVVSAIKPTVHFADAVSRIKDLKMLLKSMLVEFNVSRNEKNTGIGLKRNYVRVLPIYLMHKWG